MEIGENPNLPKSFQNNSQNEKLRIENTSILLKDKRGFVNFIKSKIMFVSKGREMVRSVVARNFHFSFLKMSIDFFGRKVMTNLDSIFKSRNITLPTKVHLVKAMVFPMVMYGCESWTVKKAEH